MMRKSTETKLKEAQNILLDLGLPKQQQNERTALCLLCLLDMTPNKSWKQASSPLKGITPIMEWSKEHYQKNYAPNTRETFRRQSMHQFIEAGICLYNPDEPSRPVNSPKACYQIEKNLLKVLQSYNSDDYKQELTNYQAKSQTLAKKYAKERDMVMIPLQLENGQEIKLSAGDHSQLIKEIYQSFGGRYVPDGKLVYVGDTGDKHGYFDSELFSSLDVVLNNHGKLPDVVIYDEKRSWLFLIESVTSHGPVDAKRYGELSELFRNCTAGLVYVSAFPNAKVYAKFASEIAWETEVWISDAPTHMIHFNGSRFLGPYEL